MGTVLESLDKDDKIACVVLTGGTRAFAGKFYLIFYINILTVYILAGADIREMHNNTLSQVIKSDFPDQLSVVSRMKKPVIAAVNGLAVCFSFLFPSVFYFDSLVRRWL